MRKTRSLLTGLMTAGCVLALAACGSSSKSSSSTSSSSAGSSSSSSSAGGTITQVMGTAPDYLDPNLSYTSQGWEMQYPIYTGLLTYAHAAGQAGSKVIPGLATSLPTITDGGKTYTFTLRKGLEFSNGKPVKASDFAWTVQRVVKLPWGGSGSFINAQIVGADAYSKGKAKSISGITTDDATGKIVIHLTAPFGPFENVLAIPPLGLVPSGTPMRNLSSNPPPGVGPYKYGSIQPNVQVNVVRNPLWSKMNVPGIPAGNVDVDVKFQSNVSAGALSVLNNSVDVFDWADIIPGSVLQQVQSQASDRFSKQVLNTTYYFFLNSHVKPFNNQLAREAVMYGLDRQALVRLGSGFWTPACFFLPPNMVGHPTGSCPYGDPAAPPNLTKAKALVKQSGMAGTPVTVWGEERTPRRQFIDYYTSMLNQIGFKATEKIVADANYFPTIGDLKLHPQTGFADWNQDFPHPFDFYGILLAGNAILPTNNQNFGEVNDPHINSETAALGKIPSTQLDSVASRWQALDTYTAQKAYVGVWGYLTAPEFTSNRIDRTALVFQPLYGFDYTSFKLK